MMQITLGESEVSALLAALNYYIPQLREEIGKTENYDMRQNLKEQETSLTEVVSRLGGSLSSNTPELGANNPPWGGGGGK